MRPLTRRSALLMLSASLAGCDTLDDLLTSPKPPVPGRREPVIAIRRGMVADPMPSRRVTLPTPMTNPDWPQPGLNPSHTAGHLAVTGFNATWRADIGEGTAYRRRLTAQTLVADGRVYAMDSDAVVTAYDLAGGGRAWRTDTQDDENRSTNIGGGITFANGAVFVVNGLAQALALDAATGAVKWRQGIDTPARSSPTVADGRLLFATIDDRLLALSVTDGSRIWVYQASDIATTVLGQPAPAVAEGLVVAGFGSGDLVALRAESGSLVWNESLASARGRNSLIDLSAITALPVIDRGRVFATGLGELTVALDLRSGRRLWEREFGGGQNPAVAGDWIFLLSSDQQLVAMSRDDGRIQWIREMPRFEDTEKQRDPIFWAGPTLVSGRLVLVSSNQRMANVDPLSGELGPLEDIRATASMAPTAAAGTMLLVTDDAVLTAYR